MKTFLPVPTILSATLMVLPPTLLLLYCLGLVLALAIAYLYCTVLRSYWPPACSGTIAITPIPNPLQSMSKSVYTVGPNMHMLTPRSWRVLDVVGGLLYQVHVVLLFPKCNILSVCRK